MSTRRLSLSLSLSVCVLLLCVLLPAAAAVASQHITVDTTYGPVIGKVEDDVVVFRGIPFAAPPVGKLRFHTPVPPQPWTKPKECFLSLKICPQLDVYNKFIGTEDCLYLDMYVPKSHFDNKNLAPLPIMAWIFGGGWAMGDAYEFGLYDGKNLARRNNVIVMAMNYRLNPAGFLALEELVEEDGSVGNQGLKDQRFALQWLQKNANAFRGDPQQVTLFGESAGAFSICFHLASPGSKGLFRAAILESGSCDTPQFWRPTVDAFAFGRDYLRLVGCNHTSSDKILDCLASMTTKQMMHYESIPKNFQWEFKPQLWPIMPWAATIDGSPNGLVDTPTAMIKEGTFNRVPVIAGTNRDEGSIFIPVMPFIIPGEKFPFTESSLFRFVAYFFNDTIASQIMELYPLHEFPSQDHRASRILRDYFFVCSERRTLFAMSDQNGMPDTFMYQFVFRPFPFVGDYHAAELDYVFDHSWPLLIPLGGEYAKMGAIMGHYWTNFAKNLDPNVGSSPVPSGTTNWPRFNSTVEEAMVLDYPTYPEIGLASSRCDFWDMIMKEL